MGLDIHLKTREYVAADAVRDAAWNEVYDSGRWDAMSDDEQKVWREANPMPKLDDPASEKYPDHLFNRRYLRSSYNGGGFNHAVPELLGSADGTYPGERGSLGWIFEPVRLDDQYEMELTEASIPALREAKERALQVVEDLRACDRLRVLTVSPNIFAGPKKTTDDEALAKYRAEVARGRIRNDGWWSSAEMDVFGSGLSILAAIPGQATFGEPGVHLIYRANDEGFDSYVQSAEIVAEFCDEAIALIERDRSCFMTWSG